MRQVKDMCVGCEQCYGYCEYRNPVEVKICDCCGEEVDELYDMDDMELCYYCKEKREEEK